MKRLGKILSIMALAITSSVAISCTEEINAPSDKEAEGTIIREFTASFETPTKTFIEEGGKVSWCKGDTIWYYTENRGETRYVVIEEDCESATINMTMNEDAEFIIAYYGGNDGGYNYSDFVSLENIVNDIQNGRFVDAHTSVAVCSDLESENLFFRNVTSLLKFSLKREDIRYVNISSKDHTPLHSYGEVFMSFFDEEIYRDYNGYYGYDIRVDLNGSGVYYAGIFPTYFKNGLRFDFLDKDMNFKGHIDIDKPIEVSENEIINFGELDSRIIEVDDSETVIYIVDHLDKGKNQQTFTPDKKHLFNVLPDYERNGFNVSIGSKDENPETYIYAHTDEYGNVEVINKDGYFLTFCYDEYLEDGVNTLKEDEFRIIITDPDDNIGVTIPLKKQYYHKGSDDLIRVDETDPFQTYNNVVDPVLRSVIFFQKFIKGAENLNELIKAKEKDKFKYENLKKAFITDLAKDAIFEFLEGKNEDLDQFIKLRNFFTSNLLEKIHTCLDALIPMLDEHEQRYANKLYGDSVPMTGGWEQLSSTQVRLYMTVENPSISEGRYYLGIVVSETENPSQKNFIYIDQTYIQQYQNEYSFEFNVQTGTKYKYRAFLRPGASIPNGLNYWIYGREKGFVLAENPENSTTVEAVDLGLSVKWASCNLGAGSPEEVGSYYAWGEIEAKDEYNLDTYLHAKNGKYTKYCLHGRDGYNGFADYKHYLSTSDDPVYNILGGKWDIPTESDWSALLSNCSWKWTTYNGVTGHLVTGPNGNSIFLPAGGYMHNDEVSCWGRECYFWQDKLWDKFWDSFCGSAYCACIRSDPSSGTPSQSFHSRTSGLPIRAVLRK